MASCSDAVLRITQNVANATVEVDATISFTEFDRNTNIGYDVFVELLGADNPPGDPDDILTSPPKRRFFVRADGRSTATVEWRPDEVARADLDEDPGGGIFGTDELKALVTAVPYVPYEVARESNLVFLN